MLNKYFYVLLFFTIFLGLILRHNHYDSIPGWREVDDEIHYSWAGWSWMHFGTPKSWSWLSSYPTSETKTVWNDEWRMVAPMLEKPPLYLLLNGILTYHLNDWSEHRLSLIRLLPISLSMMTIFLMGMVGKLIGNKTLGLLSALLYATTPFIVLANRLSVTENLLTPLALLLLVFLLFQLNKTHSKTSLSFPPRRESIKIMDPRFREDVTKNFTLKTALIAGIIAGLTMLTKQAGIVFLVPLFFFFGKKHWKLGLLSITSALTLFSLYPLMGFWFDGRLFLSLMNEARRIGIQGGLPELLYTILGRPLIATERLFPDGMILLGYLLLFTAPLWWLNQSKPNEKSRVLFLSLPLSYVGYLLLTTTGAEAIGSGQAFWGWYLYPLFPFMIILITDFLMQLWKNYSLTHVFLALGTVGTGSIHQILQFTPRAMQYRWQQLLIGLAALLIATHFLPKKQQQLVLGILGVLVVIIDVGTIWFLSSIYPPHPQP